MYSLIGFRGIYQTNDIVSREVIKAAKGHKIINFQFSAPRLNMVIALLRFVQESSYLRLGQVTILPNVFEPCPIVH